MRLTCYIHIRAFLRIHDLLLLTNTFAILLLLTYVTMFCFVEARMRYPRRWWRGTSTSPSLEYPRSEQRRITSDRISQTSYLISLNCNAWLRRAKLNWSEQNRLNFKPLHRRQFESSHTSLSTQAMSEGGGATLYNAVLYHTILFTARHHWDGSSCLSLLCSSSSLDHFPQFLSCPLIPPLTSPQVPYSTLKLYHLTRSLCTDYWQWRGFDRPFLRIHYLGRGGSSGHSQRENRSEVQPTQRHW